MVEAKRQPQDIGSIPSECVPFYLLRPREREVLQHIADGHGSKETAKILGISEGPVEMYAHNISFVSQKVVSGAWLKTDYPEQKFQVTLALIQDGIAHGYLNHTLPQEPIEPLTPREEEVLNLILQGVTNGGIRRKLWLSPKTVEAHISRIHAKLHTHNAYDTTARATYLRVHGLWPATSDRRGELSSQPSAINALI